MDLADHENLQMISERRAESAKMHEQLTFANIWHGILVWRGETVSLNWVDICSSNSRHGQIRCARLLLIFPSTSLSNEHWANSISRAEWNFSIIFINMDRNSKKCAQPLSRRDNNNSLIAWNNEQFSLLPISNAMYSSVVLCLCIQSRAGCAACVNDKRYVFDTRNNCKLRIRWFALYLIRGKTVTFHRFINYFRVLTDSVGWTRSACGSLTFNANISNAFPIHLSSDGGLVVRNCGRVLPILWSLFCYSDGEILWIG